MRIAKIFRTLSNGEKLSNIANYCMESCKQGVIFCFSKEEGEMLVSALKIVGVKAALYYKSSKGSDSKSQIRDNDSIVNEYQTGEIGTLVVPMSYKVDLSQFASHIDYLLYYDRPTLMSDYISYYDEIYSNRQPGDCFMFLVNGQIKEEYDEYFLGKSANTEMVKAIYNTYKDSTESLSEVDIAKRLGCGVGDVRYSHRYLIDKGILASTCLGSTKFKLVQLIEDFDRDDIEKEYKYLEQEYQKMLHYCWKEKM